jgi:hypothetical protein
MLTHGGSESAFYVYSHLPSRDREGAVDSGIFATESSYAFSRTAPRKSGPYGAAWSGGCGDGG